VTVKQRLVTTRIKQHQQNIHMSKNKLTTETINAVLDALASTKSASGEITNHEGVIDADLTLSAEDGATITLPLSKFNAAYQGMVRCWPGIHPVKVQMINDQRALATQLKQQEREAKEAAKVAEREAAAKKRQEEKDAKEAAKLAAKQAREQAAKDKAAKDAAAAEQKKKDDMAKAQKAAEEKAKRDAKSGEATPAPAAPAKPAKSKKK
jgi:hypothetical protein